MHKDMRRITVILFAVLSYTGIHAQISSMMNNVRTVTVKLTLSDAKTHEAVSYAACWLTEKGDTVITDYGISDDNGRVVIEGVKQGKYDVHIEMMGYEPFVKSCDIRVQEYERERNLGKVELVQSNTFLDAVTVSATAVPVKIMRDTIEYSASAYHVSENAKLGELLKKMPGIKVSNDGSVKVNGESVNKITMNGKTLFMKEPAMAVKNLPANIVDKVQVIDKAKDDAMFTGVGTKDDQEKILDLQLKEEYSQGWFGNAKLSGGVSVLPSDELEYKGQGQILYNANGMVSHYSDKDQLVLLATGMNAPEPGSSNHEYMDFDMGMDNDLLAGRQGLSTTAQTGVNYNTSRFSNLESSVNANYNYNHKTVNEESTRTSYMKDSPNLKTDGQFHGVGNTHGTSISMELMNSDKSKYLFAFRPYLNFGWQNSTSDNRTRTGNGDTEDNRSTSVSDANANTVSVYSELEMGVRNMGKEGRSLTLTGELIMDLMDGKSSERSETTFGSIIDRRDLDYDNSTRMSMPELELSYVEPLGRNLALQLRTSGRLSRSVTDKVANDLNDASRNDYYSSYSRNEDTDLRQRLLVQYKKSDDASLLLGMQVNEEHNVTTTRHLGKDSEVGRGDWILNWAPFIDYTHETDELKIRLNYAGRSTTPSGARIIPTIDISNPVQISAGNIYLRPQFTHDMFLTLRKNNPDNFSFFEIFMDGSLRSNQIVTARWFDAQSVSYSIPVNAKDLGANAMVFLSYSRPFGKDDNFTLTLDADANFDLGVGYQATMALPSIDKDHFNYSDFMTWFWKDSEGERFYSGKSGFAANRSKTISMSLFPSLMYRQDWLSVTAMCFAMNSRSRYSFDSSNNMNTWDFGTNMEIIATTPKNWEFSSDISYMWYRGYTQGYGTPELLWNAGIAKSLGKFTLSLKASDILNRQKSLHRTTATDYVEDVHRTVMGRYVMLGVAFNFGKMNSSQGEQVERALWEMQW